MRLVTGATGLVGSYVVCQLLLQGHSVRALKRKNASTDWFMRIAQVCGITKNLLEEKLEWVEGDLNDIIGLEQNLTGVERVYHCAAVVTFKKNQEENLFNTNVGGTANLVNVCLSAHVQKLCYISSIAALSRKKETEQIDETAEWEDSKLNSNYSKSKFMGELEVWRGKEEGLEVVILNPGFILGFGNPDRSSASIFKKIAKGFTFYTQGVNGYVDVLDVAKAAVLLNEGDNKSERFVLVGFNISYKELFFTIAKEMGKRPPTFEVRPWMAKTLKFTLNILANIGIRTNFITPETITNSMNKYYYNSDKIKTQTGFEFTPKEHTIRRIVSEFKEYGGKPF
ncbi:MAG: NAD-dependent epimerase/dehydratase family protein [Bacteroidia bacterium]|nr:NAD-dependent epimerase/dehydratase family protein [Bacteroidia bacterium]MCO5253779.1 NAD-dependent epimerase/dehydratase family protein [Bacteroidota bacterium]